MTTQFSLRFPRTLGLILASGLLGGCLGGDLEISSAGAAAPATPTLTLTPERIKSFSFSWEDVESETEYRLLEAPDGQSGFSQVAIVAQDVTSYSHEVALHARANSRYILQACNSVGCADSDEVHVASSLAEAVGYFKASNTDFADYFAGAVSLSADGNTLAVGANGEDSSASGINGDGQDNAANNSGAVYVFQRSGNTWNQQAYLKASNTDAADEFGFSVSLSSDGDTLAVGARLEDSSTTGVNGTDTNNDAGDSGAVFVFQRSGDTWNQQAYLKASNTDAADEFGYSVSLSGDGDTLAIGARFEDGNATVVNGTDTSNDALDSGAVFVFQRSGDTWSQQAYLKAFNTGASDQFGYSVTLATDGDILAVGAIYEDSNARGVNLDGANNDGSNNGAVYVFQRIGATWNQQAYLKASNADSGDLFGLSVSLAADGDTLAVGAHWESSNDTGVNGDSANNDSLGSGAVYVFESDGQSWSQQVYLKSSNADTDDLFGRSVSLSADGNTLAVGAVREDGNATGVNGDQANNDADNSGAVYVFQRSGATWGQLSYLKSSNSEAGDFIGSAISLAADGNTLAVSAIFEDSATIGINGDQDNNDTLGSGAVFLY